MGARARGTSPKSVAPEPTDDPPTLRGLAALEAQLQRHGLVRKGQRQVSIPAVEHNSKPLPNIRKLIRLARAGNGEVDVAIAVRPRKEYPSYTDLWRLFDLAGFEMLYQDEIDLADARQTYIFASPEAIPDCTHARARTIFWQLEYAGDYTSVVNANTASERWSSDPVHAARTGARFVLLGSHRHLNPDLSGPKSPEHDLTMLGYLIARRREMQQRLSRYRWSPDYPGHGTAERHALLRDVRLMLHVHQHDEPAAAPLRYAIAAAYRLPVISEAIPDTRPYGHSILWAKYDDLPMRVDEFFAGRLDEAGLQNDALYRHLCVEHPFGRNINEALATAQHAALREAA